MLTLKHLARDFDVEPYPLRMALRAAGLQPQHNKRWKWETDQDPGYVAAQKVAKSLSSRLKSKSTNTSDSDD